MLLWPLALVCGYALALAFLIVKRVEFFQTFAARMIALIPLLALWALGFVLESKQPAGYFGAAGIGIVYVTFPALCSAPFVWTTIPIVFDAIRSTAVSDNQIRPLLTYDRAEKAEVERRHEEAISIYRTEYQPRDPKDPVPRVRVAALLETLGRRAEAVEELRAALPLIEDEENRAIQAAHASDLLVRLDRAVEAAGLLEAVVIATDSDAVRERLTVRLEALRKRLETGGGAPPLPR